MYTSLGRGVRVVYIAGYGRSGTTLAGRLLGQLPGAVDVGELVHLWRRGVTAGESCGCGQPFPACPVWAEVGRRTTGWHIHVAERHAWLRDRVDHSRYVPHLAAGPLPARFAAWLDEYQSLYLRTYQAVCEVTRAEVVIDSSKHASLAYVLARSPWIDLRVIHLVRDPRAVAWSWTRPIPRPDAGPGRRMRTYPPARTALRWAYQNALIEGCPAPVLRVRYEDLTASPHATLARMAEHAGLPPRLPLRVADGTAIAMLSPGHTASGHPTRLDHGDIPITRDDTWRTSLPAAAQTTVTALTFPQLRRYGYS